MLSIHRKKIPMITIPSGSSVGVYIDMSLDEPSLLRLQNQLTIDEELINDLFEPILSSGTSHLFDAGDESTSAKADYFLARFEPSSKSLRLSFEGNERMMMRPRSIRRIFRLMSTRYCRLAWTKFAIDANRSRQFEAALQRLCLVVHNIILRCKSVACQRWRMLIWTFNKKLRNQHVR